MDTLGGVDLAAVFFIQAHPRRRDDVGNLQRRVFFYSLLESGWRMDEIDRMDMPGFLKIRAWNAKREQEKKAPRQRYIDEVWTELKPVNSQ